VQWRGDERDKCVDNHRLWLRLEVFREIKGQYPGVSRANTRKRGDQTMSDYNQKETDEGTIEVLLERAKIRIPNLLAIKERLLEGETISDIEIVELDSAMSHVKDFRALLNRHPELHEIVVKMASLYDEITELALANEEKGGGPSRIKPD
jgi:hypothetical protein